jgi:UDP-N-acetylmuramyl pentapeptide phosphotransferase/UDP-N-acetylglucosamine-1-phosphate transferase
VPSWALAFVTATAVALVGTPVLRRLATATGFVDHPAPRKSHRHPIPYLGGIAIITSVLVALLFEARAAPRVGVLMVGAAALGAMGLLDDDRTVDPRFRFLAETLAAVLAVVVGVRIHATGIEALDILITIVWIVGVTNAINLLDNMDALAAGVSAVTALSVFALAILGRQPVVATLAGAVAGACLGFLVYNRPPASIFMGDAGSLFLGFVLAILTINVSPAVFPPVSFLIPLLLLAIPVLDTTVVTVARLRRGRPVSQGGRDHLSHRLAKRGLRRRRAVAVLIGCESVLGVLAVLAGRRIVPVTVAVLVAVAMVGGLLAVTAKAVVYREPVVGFPRPLKRAVFALLLAMPILGAPAVIALARANAPARAGADAANRALDAFRTGDSDASAALFRKASDDLATAKKRLGGPLVSLGLLVPGLSSNLNASRTLVAVGTQLAVAGIDLAQVADIELVGTGSGHVPLDRLKRLTPALDRAVDVVERSRGQIGRLQVNFLLPPLSSAVRELSGRLERETRATTLAAESAHLLPAILGDGGTRRYFLAFQNNAELRGTGGFMGNWGEVVGEGGRLRLERFGRLEELNEAGTRPRVLTSAPGFFDRWRMFNPGEFWEQVNVSPDFPTTARLISELYPQSGGSPIDGVIAVDPPGLSAMLKLTGPVTLPNWPVPIASDNVVDITLRQAYEKFPQDQRVAFLGDLARQVAEAFTRADLGRPAQVTAALGSAAGDGHLLVWMARPEEQALIARLGIDGSIDELKGDSLLVVNQNLAANKVDSFFRRHVRYDVTLDPSHSPAALQGRLEVIMDNDAPATGLSPQVLGPYDDRFQAGENRTYVSVYSPFADGTATVDGRPVTLENQPDLGRTAQSTILSIPSKSSTTLAVDLEGEVKLSDGGWYRLDLFHQPSLTPDDVEISVAVPKGWRIVQVQGLEADGGRRATTRLALDGPVTLLVRVERAGWSGVWERLSARS